VWSALSKPPVRAPASQQQYRFQSLEAEVGETGLERRRFLLEHGGDSVVAGSWFLVYFFKVAEVAIDDVLRGR
jgi:hypothetical protein